MALMILSQERNAETYYLKPNDTCFGDCCTYHIGSWGLYRFPNTGEENWEDVDDPIDAPDYDETYVYTDTGVVSHDWYRCEDLTIAGTVNWIKVHAIAKSHIYSPHPNATYKIRISDDDCSNEYESDNKQLVTVYRDYNYTWNTNPRTGLAWTVEEVNDLQIGVECGSPSLSSDTTEILYPDSAGDLTQLNPFGIADNWDCVDESPPDDDITYVYGTAGSTLTDLYNLDDSSIDVGATIKKIVVFARCRKKYGTGNMYAFIEMKTGGVTTSSPQITLDSIWTNYSIEYINNPVTGLAWTVADLNALQAGITLVAPGTGYPACTQVYVVVYYNNNVNAEMRTTQMYVEVNLNLLDATCYLPVPEEISTNHDQNIKIMNFWSGNRAVYGLSRSGRTTVMTGKVWDGFNTSTPTYTACEAMLCVREMAEYGETITITNSGAWIWNNDYRIISFGWKKISEAPEVYDWYLEIEHEE